jgi:hypothetical protein
MKTTNPLGNRPATQFYLSCKDLINLALKRKPVMVVARRDTLRGMMFAPLDQMRFGREHRRGSKQDLGKVEKEKAREAAEKERDEATLKREIGKETKGPRQEKAKYLASSSARETDTANGGTTAGIATRERKGAKENPPRLSSSRAKTKRPRKN